ncbi:MAG: hypothetical protein CMM52_12085 [Rhodospirillaceae bacterium]|nr:hypothetical protein [Rhodospirillaceae bacterium]|tara:strand:+ start:37342 stop:37674 length:333 start_codon:yes stop_codon:yes gene_type:complete
MSNTTEIYICYPGQSIKEGKCEYSDIQTRMEADSDAARRFAADPGIAKIAYYKVNEDGDFKIMCTKENANVQNTRGRKKLDSGARTHPDRKRRAPKKQGLFGRLKSALAD